MESLQGKLRDKENYIKQLERTLEEQRKKQIHESEPIIRQSTAVPSVKDKKLRELESRLGELEVKYSEVKKKHKQLEEANNDLSEQLAERAREEEENRIEKERLANKFTQSRSESESLKSSIAKYPSPNHRADCRTQSRTTKRRKRECKKKS
eukprot:TRINITY_DN8526_c0_g1_i1.p1 TRINITY_DN8526_c0_g1~~TRINITY_DN8526_c0_g1_i1.p1  ORF type:complete len:152 (+),score=46.51 TRINITY_DN8526_c0_g1_i1:551-1006(+)